MCVWGGGLLNQTNPNLGPCPSPRVCPQCLSLLFPALEGLWVGLVVIEGHQLTGLWGVGSKCPSREKRQAWRLRCQAFIPPRLRLQGSNTEVPAPRAWLMASGEVSGKPRWWGRVRVHCPPPTRAWEPQGSSEQDQEVEGGTNFGQNFPAISPCTVSISKRKQRDRWGHWSPEISHGGPEGSARSGGR